VDRSEQVWWATGLETPVFLDERGHRAKLVRFGATCALLLIAAWLALVVSGPFGFGSLPAAQLLVPHHHHHHVFAGLHHRDDRGARPS
jgi:hypothetical protein